MNDGPLDFAKLQTAYWRALCRHHVSELEMVMAVTIARLSFGIGEPCLRLDFQIELAKLTGMSKGKTSEVIRRLVGGRALEVSRDRCICTPLPPSKAWPWLFAERLRPEEAQAADTLEEGVIWANKGPQQGEFFAPDAAHEFADAMALERMRAALIDSHRAAEARFAHGLYGGLEFPVTDRSPTPAPAPGLSSSEGQSRPPGTSVAGNLSAEETFSRRPEKASENALPDPGIPDEAGSGAAIRPGLSQSESVPEKGTDGSRKGNPVPEKGTVLLKALKSQSSVQPFEPLKALKAEFPNREPSAMALIASRPATGPEGEALSARDLVLKAPDPGCTEEELVEWLRPALGKLCAACFDARRKRCTCQEPVLVPVMERFGGWWRLQIRGSRWAVLNACMQLVYRLSDRTMKPLRNRGGWLRDEYLRIRGEEASMAGKGSRE